jgi:hypothetical protein
VSDANRRIWVGRTGDGTAAISLMDGAGRKRIAMEVPLSGNPKLEIFDEKGQVVQSVTAGAQ